MARQSPREHRPGRCTSAFLTAVDADVLEDHTLVTLQSDAALRCAVSREEEPPRLIIDLPDHTIAPGYGRWKFFALACRSSNRGQALAGQEVEWRLG